MVSRRRSILAPCSPKPALQDRPLLAPQQAMALREVFRILANETRLRLLHALVRTQEVCVTDLAEAVGMKPQAVSNQLQRLVNQGILECRREGNHIYYRIIDPCVVTLFDQGLCLLEDAQERKP